jgi:tRNA G37 N-methylase Trm5
VIHYHHLATTEEEAVLRDTSSSSSSSTHKRVGFSDTALAAAYSRHREWSTWGIGFMHVCEAVQRISSNAECLLLNFSRVKNYAPKLIHAVSDVLVLLQPPSSLQYPPPPPPPPPPSPPPP